MTNLEIRASPKLSPTILDYSSCSQHSCHSAIACGCFTQASTATTTTTRALISHHPWIVRARRRWLNPWHFFTVSEKPKEEKTKIRSISTTKGAL